MNNAPSTAALTAHQNSGPLQGSIQTIFAAVSAGLVAITSNGRIVGMNQDFADLGRTEVQTLLGEKASSVLDFSGIFKYSRTRLAEVSTAKYQGQLSVLGSPNVSIAFTCRRMWIDGCRIFLMTAHRLDSHVFERKKLRALQENLELKVKLRTVALANRVRELDEARTQLSSTIQKLRQTQDSLISAEKLAALGSMVAGIAHEINTPLGIGVTASSHLSDALIKLNTNYSEGALTQDDMEEFIKTSEEASLIITRNLCRASELIRSFKQVAVDQSLEDIRQINLKDYFEDVLLSLLPKTKNTPHTVRLDCPDTLEVMTYPGALAQILTNLITNSLTHAFAAPSTSDLFITSSSPVADKAGEMLITVNLDENNNVSLTYRDNGSGIPESLIKTVFDPFVTSKRGQGGTGLGLHILHNLVTQKLGGTVTCTSEAGAGVCFEICWPADLAHNHFDSILSKAI